VLQTDRKKKVTFFFFLQLLRPNQAVKLALGTVVVGSLQLKYVHTLHRLTHPWMHCLCMLYTSHTEPEAASSVVSACDCNTRQVTAPHRRVTLTRHQVACRGQGSPPSQIRDHRKHHRRHHHMIEQPLGSLAYSWCTTVCVLAAPGW
jgi:hypothetical protein